MHLLNATTGPCRALTLIAPDFTLYVVRPGCGACGATPLGHKFGVVPQ